MDFLHASVALLASMVLVLAGMVGWLYWQQTRIFQNMNSIVMVIGELARPSMIEEKSEPIPVPPPSPASEDDRVSVDEEPEVETESKVDIVDGPEIMDTDGLESKTKKELADMLTKRGIPYSKNDNKTTLISLLKATA